MTSGTGTDTETIHEVGDVDSVLSERCVGGVRVFTVWTCHVQALVTTDNWTIISGRNCGINSVLRVEARGFFSREEHASLHRHIVAHMCDEVVFELMCLGIPLSRTALEDWRRASSRQRMRLNTAAIGAHVPRPRAQLAVRDLW